MVRATQGHCANGVHNGERYLREFFASILAQTFDDFEFLIVNDGSRDRTRELIRSYDDTRLRLVDNEQNLGQTRSLNRGLRLATGEFIARQDADDVSEPQRLAKQVAFLESDPNLTFKNDGCYRPYKVDKVPAREVVFST